jgi:hypothetical protein
MPLGASAGADARFCAGEIRLARNFDVARFLVAGISLT